MDISGKTRNLLYMGIGIGGLLFSRYYSGPMEGFTHSYGANVTFSFFAYFLLKFFRLPLSDNKYMNAAYALLCVSAQEVTQRVGLYPGTYDSLDFLFNAAGIGLALGVDILRSRKRSLGNVI